MSVTIANNRIDVFSRISLFLLLIGMGFFISPGKHLAEADPFPRYTSGILGAMIATAFLMFTKMVMSVIPGTLAITAERTTHSIVYGILLISLVSMLFGSEKTKTALSLQEVPSDDLGSWAHNCLLLAVCVFVCVFAPLMWTNPYAMVFGIVVALAFLWMDYTVDNSEREIRQTRAM
jgi:hypothetical protein